MAWPHMAWPHMAWRTEAMAGAAGVHSGRASAAAASAAVICTATATPTPTPTRSGISGAGPDAQGSSRG